MDQARKLLSSRYLDQLCTIAVGGALGLGAVLMARTGALENLLVPFFQKSMLVGGICLVVVAAVRALVLWRSAGRPVAVCQHHAHDHTHDACHDHYAVHHHEHETHEHAFYPVRYTVLLLPVTLMFLGMPSRQFNEDYVRAKVKEVAGKLSAQTEEIELQPLASKGDQVLYLDVRELERAAMHKETRDFYEGQTARIKGVFAPSNNDRVFNLFRLWRGCCDADAIPIKALIVSRESVTHVHAREWVEVEGQLRFHEVRSNEYLPILQVTSNDKIVKIPPAPSVFLQ